MMHAMGAAVIGHCFRTIASIGVIAFTLLMFACGTGDPAPQGMAAQLADAVPRVDVVRAAAPFYQGEVTVTGKFTSNEQMAAGEGFLLLWYTDDVDELRASGRVNGYQAEYKASFTQQGPVAGLPPEVTVAYDLYESAELAQAALDRPPYASVAQVHAPNVGDATVAWAVGYGPRTAEAIDRASTCRCKYRFRVDRIVAEVRAGEVHWSPSEEVRPSKIAVARLLSERIRALLEQPIDTET